MKKQAYLVVILMIAIFGVGSVVLGYSGSTNVVVEGDYIASGEEVSLGAIPGTDVYQDMVFYGSVNSKEKSVTVAQTGATSTVIVGAENSGSTYYLSATGTTITLPVVTTGANYKFVINGSAGNANFVIDSNEGDNIEGTLLVAGAVVDCAGEDQINFVTDGENVGDFVEVRSDGTQWLIGASGALTAGKMTCTDPS